MYTSNQSPSAKVGVNCRNRRPFDVSINAGESLDVASPTKFYNLCGTAEQRREEDKNAVKWTRLSRDDFVDNPVRLPLFALEYNLGNFLRRMVLPIPVKHCTVRRAISAVGIGRNSKTG